MATLIAYANGNLTDASATWKTCEAGTDATQFVQTSTTNVISSTYTWSSAFTITNGSVIEGIALLISRNNSTSATFTVGLSEDGGSTAVREVSVSTADFGTYSSGASSHPTWYFFKFSSTYTGDGGVDYKVGVKATGASTIVYGASSNNHARALRTSTTAQANTGDNMIIAPEYTAASTYTAFSVIMDSVASTDYGFLGIGRNCSLAYGYSASTNYYLKLSGNLTVGFEGTFTMGTSANPIPRNSTAVLEFDPTTDGEFGFISYMSSTVSMQGLSRTSGKNIYYCLLNTDEAIASTSLGVDTDTGWLDNDEIAIGSTTQTYSQAEKGALNGDAGASTLTVDGFAGAGGGIAYAHGGTSPVQAEVILLTRNVKVRSSSSTIMSYVYFAEGTIDVDWVEFYYLGEAATGKYGVTVNVSTGSFNMQYSSIHDCEDGGLYNSSALNNFTLSYNVLYNTASATANGGIYIVATSNVLTITYNIVMRCSASSNYGIYLGDMGSTVTNNIASSNNGNGFRFAESGVSVGTFSDNIAHSNAAYGMAGISSTQYITATFTNCTAWRNASYGFYIGITNYGVLDNYVAFGNGNANILLPQGVVILNSVTLSSDSTFSTPRGITAGYFAKCYIYNSDFSVVTGIKTAHTTSDIDVGSSYMAGDIFLYNTTLGATTEVSSYLSLPPNSSVRSQKHDKTAGNHKTWTKGGIITIDTTASMYRTASPSVRLTPGSASNKLETGGFKVNVNSGQTCTPSIYVRESVVGDGTDYNGNRTRLILKRNDAIGITSDTTIDTATVSSEGAFEQLTGTTAAAADDGVMEFVVDCDGTTGWVNVDDFSATVA